MGYSRCQRYEPLPSFSSAVRVFLRNIPVFKNFNKTIPMEITNIAGLSEPIKRLIEVISRGVGNISEPYLTKKNADAKAYEIKVIADAVTEGRKKLTQPEYYNGKVNIILAEEKPDSVPTLQNRMTARLEHQTQCNQQNIEAICANAAEELSQETSAPDEKPEPEWISRFFEISSGITTEQLQNIWGRILAGEVKRPGSFSLRTLDVIRNLSRKEAESFVKLCNYVLRSGDKMFFIYPKDTIFANKCGLTFNEILPLKDAGLVFESELEYSFNPSKVGETSHLIYGPLIIFIEREKDTLKLGSNVGLLTRVGIELLQLVNIQPDMKYIDIVCKSFNKEGVKFAFAKIKNLDGEKIEYENKTYKMP